MVDAARVAVVAEAWSRGVVEATAHGTASTAAAVEWIQDSGPVGGEQFSRGVAGDALPVDRATAARLARLAQAAQVGTRTCLVDAVTSARVGLVAGVVALAEYERLAPRLAERVTQEALGWFVQVARSNEVAEVRRLRPAIVARYGRDGELEHQQERARACRVFTTPVSMGDGLCEYTLVADSESVAVIEAAIDHLAAPAPTKAEPDLRSCGQRRFDALLAVINRAVAAGTATPGRPRAQVMVTIPIADLVSGVRGAGATLGHPDPGRARIRAGGGSGGSGGSGGGTGGASGGAGGGSGGAGGGWCSAAGEGGSGGPSRGWSGGEVGRTGKGKGVGGDVGGSACDGGGSACDGGSAGDGAGRAGRTQGGGTLIDPGTVRRLACDADLIPVVLGGSSEPLDVGRTHRLVTSAIRTALWLRDRGCTYPGCATPAAWTDAHHILHWSAGGNSCLDNLTLLCGRHHTAVHKTGAVALIQDGQVQWAIPARRRQCA